MLLHHSGQDYEVAASEAATEARGRFESRLEAGKAQAMTVVEAVEQNVPKDRVVKGDKLTFALLEGKDGETPSQLTVSIPGEFGGVETFHKHAISQAAERVRMSNTYVNELQGKGDWGIELLAHNLNKLFEHQAGRFLTRSVDNQVRGFLSDSYRRLDSRPIVEQFLIAATNLGAIPIDGYAMETKIAIKMVLPMVFEPIRNEVMIYGAVLENSDFGNGALSLRSFVERLACTNRAIATEDLRKVHLGSRLADDIAFSQTTYELDTKTQASAVKDMVEHTLSSGSVNQYMTLLKKAHENKLDFNKTREWLKKNLLKGEVDAVVEAFNSADVEMLPAGNSTWRMSNAISWIANSRTPNQERKLELMKVAGSILQQAA